MSNRKERFSDRIGAVRPIPEVSIREGAPERLRIAVIHFALDAGATPQTLRSVILRVLDVPPDPDLLRADDNVVREAQEHLRTAEWFEVYDVVEAISKILAHDFDSDSRSYAERLNRMMVRLGVAWQLRNGRVESRGGEAFEYSIDSARTRLGDKGFDVARSEIDEALRDLSRRPEADLTGAVRHAFAALECVSREATEARSETLGSILKRNPNLFPPPLNAAVEKLWGYSSEYARHVREGRVLRQEEAELVVGLSASLVSYLCCKLERNRSPTRTLEARR